MRNNLRGVGDEQRAGIAASGRLLKFAEKVVGNSAVHSPSVWGRPPCGTTSLRPPASRPGASPSPPPRRARSRGGEVLRPFRKGSRPLCACHATLETRLQKRNHTERVTWQTANLLLAKGAEKTRESMQSDHWTLQVKVTTQTLTLSPMLLEHYSPRLLDI